MSTEKPAALQCIEAASNIQLATVLEQLKTFGSDGYVTVVLGIQGMQPLQVQVPMEHLYAGLNDYQATVLRKLPEELQMDSFLDQVQRETEKHKAMLQQSGKLS